MATNLIDIRSISTDAAPRLSATGFGWNQLPLYSSSIDLYADGCLIHSEINCTAACAEPAIAWASFHTLMNCLMYPMVSGLIASNALTSAGMKVATSFEIYHSREVDLSLIQTTIDACAKSFCDGRAEETPVEQCFRGFMASSAMPKTAVAYVEANSQQIIDFASGICPDSPYLGNVDIGGIGVYLSYIVQLFLILMAWGYALILDYCHARALAGQEKATRKKRGAHAKNAASVRKKYIHRQRSARNQQDAVMVGVYSFQNAQTYFAITLSLATFIALAGNGTIFDAVTYQQIGITVALFGDAAATSVVCMTFGLHLLHKADNKARAPAALSLVATILAVIAFGLTRRPLFNLRPRETLTIPIPACGPSNTPAKFCTAPDKLHYSTQFEAPIIAVCSVLMLDILRHYITNAPKKWPKLRWYLGGFLLTISTVVMMIWLIDPHAMGFSRRSNFDWVSNGVWSFGQIIAISIWAPAICEYAWATKFGVDDYRAKPAPQAPAQYAIMRVKKDV